MQNKNQALHDAIEAMDLSTITEPERKTKKEALLLLLGADFQVKTELTKKQKSDRLDVAKTTAVYQRITGTPLSPTEEINLAGLPAWEDIIRVAAHNLVMINEFERIVQITADNFTQNGNKARLERIRDTPLNDDNSIRDRSCVLTNGLPDWQPTDREIVNCRVLITMSTEKLDAMNEAKTAAANEKLTILQGQIAEKLRQCEALSEYVDEVIESEDNDPTSPKLKAKLIEINNDIETKKNELTKKKTKQQQLTLENDLDRLKHNRALLKVALKTVPNATERLNDRRPSIEQRRNDLRLLLIRLEHDGDYQLTYCENFPDLNARTAQHIYCKRTASDSLEYSLLDPLDNNKINTHTITCADLGIRSDFVQDTLRNDDVKKKLLTVSNAKKHTFPTYESYVSTNDKVGVDVDDQKFREIAKYVDELTKDMNRSEKSLKRCADIAKDPEKNRGWMPKEANFLIKVVAELKPGEFKEEVKRKGVVQEAETQHGIEGQVVYRGIYLGKDDVKSVSRTSNCGKEIRYEQDQTGRVTDHSTVKFSELGQDEKEKAALKFAEMLLHAYEPGSGDPITLNGGAEHAEQAQMVYAALLTLTSSNGEHDKIKFDPSCIKVDVPGCDQPNWYWTWRDTFKKKHIPNETAHVATIKESTGVYRERFHKEINDKGEDIAPIYVGVETKLKP
ncbi:MAG: hypothetical protein Q8R24_02345 [Legionellaceae bacterium]|nr:hypothetical protein [Legionellaceae bacterium]